MAKLDGSTRIPLIADIEAGEAKGDYEGTTVASAAVNIRLGFLRKVFGIVGIQLLITTLTSAYVILWPGAKDLVRAWPVLPMIGIFASIGLLLTMMALRHQTPVNYVLLALWTAVEAYTVAAIVTFYDVEVVVVALLLTTVVTLSLFFYTLQSTHDWSAKGAALFTALCILLVGGMLQLLLMSPAFDLLLSIGGAALFSLYIIFDVHMMLHHLSAEEYILAAINLYLDIVNLFLHILRILQHAQRH